jgi:hypothetical protein
MTLRSEMLPTGDPAEAGLSAERLARLDRAFADLAASGRIPGAVTLVARRGRIVHVGAVGRRSPTDDAPMTADRPPS